ncbi:MAG: hypothetical protein U1E77_11945 [Inhella sp.]
MLGLLARSAQASVWLLLCALGLSTPLARATPGLREVLFVNSKPFELFGMTDGMRSFPWSEPLREVERKGFRCSAWGAPVQKLALQGKQLLLVGFGRCGPDDFGLTEAYGPPGAPMPAEWITGPLWYPRGRLLCGDSYSQRIWERHVHLDVKQGRVERMRTVDMRKDPLVPSRPKADRRRCLVPKPPPPLPPQPFQVIPRQN